MIGQSLFFPQSLVEGMEESYLLFLQTLLREVEPKLRKMEIKYFFAPYP